MGFFGKDKNHSEEDIKSSDSASKNESTGIKNQKEEKIVKPTDDIKKQLKEQEEILSKRYGKAENPEKIPISNQGSKTIKLEDIIMDFKNDINTLNNRIEILHISIEEMKKSTKLAADNKNFELIKIEGVLGKIESLIEKNNTNQSKELDTKLLPVFEVLNELQKMVNNLKETTDNVKTQLEFSQSVNTVSSEVSEDVSKEAEKIADTKDKYHIVEMFIESGNIKFRISNTSTPFYIHQVEESNTLIINDKNYHTANIDSIERCFRIEGERTGKYENIEPAKCYYNKQLNDWTLTNKGKIKGVSS